MDNKEFALEAWRAWIKNRLSNKVALVLIFSGIALLTPAWWYGLANAVVTHLTESNLEPFKESSTTGWILLSIGLALVALNIWENKTTRNKEVIGIRHKSLGSFPKEAITPDLPYLQKLRHYREVDVDHTDSYKNGVLVDHQSIQNRIEKVPIELDAILNTSINTPIAYYGLTHIPLAFYLGYLLSDNKYLVQLYEMNNNSGKWNQLGSVAPQLKLVTDYEDLTSTTKHGDVILSIGISYPVHPSEIEELEITNILGVVSINAAAPQRQLISSEYQIDQVCSEFRSVLEHIKNTCPNRQRIHLFYSGPVSLSFALGRCLSERIDSEIVIYNYSIKETPKYNWHLSLNNPSVTPIFSITSQAGDEHASV